MGRYLDLAKHSLSLNLHKQADRETIDSNATPTDAMAAPMMSHERNELYERRVSLAEAEAEYHTLWLRGCHLDDQLQAAKEAGETEHAARLRAELSDLIEGPYEAARRRYDAALREAV